MHQIWYLKKKDPPNTPAAALFGRYYAEDVANRLYSAGEHLANGIIMMLEISDQELRPFRSERRKSQQLIVGKYLRQKMISHPAREAVIKLSDSQNWGATITYRNQLVHEQPPTVKGLGVEYRRKPRWEFSQTTKRHVLRGGGDKPDYCVDDIVRFMKPAVSDFIDAFVSVLEYYNTAVEAWIQDWNDVAGIKIQ